MLQRILVQNQDMSKDNEEEQADSFHELIYQQEESNANIIQCFSNVDPMLLQSVIKSIRRTQIFINCVIFLKGKVNSSTLANPHKLCIEESNIFTIIPFRFLFFVKHDLKEVSKYIGIKGEKLIYLFQFKTKKIKLISRFKLIKVLKFF